MNCAANGRDQMKRLVLGVAVSACLQIALTADVLVLRDGTRVQGELISVRNGVVQFEEHRGSGQRRTITINRHEISRIELDERAGGGGGFDGPGVGGGRPSGLRERTLNVDARAGCSDTTIDVRAGQTVYFQASGEVRWGRDRRDGPEGEDNSPVNPGRPMPNRPAASLIGRVGQSSSDYFFIGGEAGPIRLRSSGRLSLCINDEYLQDNSGSFRVVVYY
jgi:hypothetical protein